MSTLYDEWLSYVEDETTEDTPRISEAFVVLAAIRDIKKER